jgi:hypothetical protein
MVIRTARLDTEGGIEVKMAQLDYEDIIATATANDPPLWTWAMSDCCAITTFDTDAKGNKEIQRTLYHARGSNPPKSFFDRLADIIIENHITMVTIANGDTGKMPKEAFVVGPNFIEEELIKSLKQKNKTDGNVVFDTFFSSPDDDSKTGFEKGTFIIREDGTAQRIKLLKKKAYAEEGDEENAAAGSSKAVDKGKRGRQEEGGQNGKKKAPTTTSKAKGTGKGNAAEDKKEKGKATIKVKGKTTVKEVKKQDAKPKLSNFAGPPVDELENEDGEDEDIDEDEKGGFVKVEGLDGDNDNGVEDDEAVDDDEIGGEDEEDEEDENNDAVDDEVEEGEDEEEGDDDIEDEEEEGEEEEAEGNETEGDAEGDEDEETAEDDEQEDENDTEEKDGDEGNKGAVAINVGAPKK